MSDLPPELPKHLEYAILVKAREAWRDVVHNGTVGGKIASYGLEDAERRVSVCVALEVRRPS
jgi:cell wall assembly regulator SMI1